MYVPRQTPYADSTRDPDLSGSVAGAGEKTILIVEDEEGIRAVLEELLQMEGYKTTSAENGDEGLACLGQGRYDLIFTDLNMPGVSGRDIARAAKQSNPSTPVVIITGWDTNTLAAELKGDGVDRVLKKPFDMDTVLTMVSELISGS
ncbi:MAG: response regulator [Chloroflexi bacterium]|nr:response regulator [Chloroflexota bacterium]